MTLLLRRRPLLVALAGCAMLSAARAQPRVFDETWHDASRARDLPVRVRLPALPNWPLVLYSHGLGGNRQGGDVWGDAWAAAGVAVVHVQHAGSDSAVWRQGAGALRQAGNAEQLAARVADLRFVLDEVLRRHAAGIEPWRGLQPEAIGMAGHSFGAHTAQALAGQRYPAATRWSEPRIRAFAAFSPSSGRGQITVAESFGAVTRPFLALTGSLDGDPFGSYSDGGPRALVYDGLPAGQRALLWLEGADHMSFGGNRDTVAAAAMRRQPVATRQEAAHQAIVAQLTSLWWRAHLMADRDAMAQFRQRPGVKAPDHLLFD